MDEGITGTLFFRLMQFATVGMGCICVALSFLLFFHFIHSRKPIGKAVALMLLGESIGAGCTVIFAIAADGVLNMIGPGTSMIIRWIMFSTAAITSLHLGYQTWKIEVSDACQGQKEEDE